MLTAIIPTDESERALVQTLATLVAGAADGLLREVIIADAGSKDDTLAVADVAGCRFEVVPGPLGPRLKAAAASARATWLMFLRPGMLLDRTWVSEAAQFIHAQDLQPDDAISAAAFRPGAAAGRPLMAEAFSLLRLALARGQRPEQGLIIAKRAYDALGGHRDVADPEADLLRRVGRRRIVMLRAAATISA
jgi:hypothetical protein